MITDKILMACPHCGSVNTEPANKAAQAGMLIGGMAGAGYTINRLINRPFPVLATALIAGCVLGLMWGAQMGRAIGGTIDETLLRGYRCLSCGEEFQQ